MDGNAVIASTMVRTNRLKPPATSLRKTAHTSPAGIQISRAMEICHSVPTIACRMPPTLSGSTGPASAIDSV